MAHAAQLTPDGASYKATVEPFVTGRPLNVTDLEFGADGAMYFITGGRGTQSGLYRVRYVGGTVKEIDPVDPKSREFFNVALALDELVRAGTGVRVNGVAPGLIETGMTKPIFDRAREKGTDDKIGQLNALRRAGQPEEIAETVVFLLSGKASFTTGSAVFADGGQTI